MRDMDEHSRGPHDRVVLVLTDRADAGEGLAAAVAGVTGGGAEEEVRVEVVTPGAWAEVLRGANAVLVVDLRGPLPAAEVLAAVAPPRPALAVAPTGDGRRTTVLGWPLADVVAPDAVADELSPRLARLLAIAAREQRASEELAQSRQQVERFAYTASHDLKEPLRAVTGFSRLLQSRHADSLDESARTYLDFIVDGGERMTEMIQGMGRFSRLARAEVALEPVDTHELVTGALRRLGPDDCDVELGRLDTVVADLTLLDAAVEAVLDNACKFRSDAGTHRVEVRTETGDAGAMLVVSDTGVGIPADEHRRVFDMFTRLHTREQYPGQGLGLAIAELAVSRMGGRIDLTSAPGEGTTVRMVLPPG